MDVLAADGIGGEKVWLKGDGDWIYYNKYI